MTVSTKEKFKIEPQSEEKFDFLPLDRDLARMIDEIVDSLQPLRHRDRKFIVDLLSMACLLKQSEYSSEVKK